MCVCVCCREGRRGWCLVQCRFSRRRSCEGKACKHTKTVTGNTPLVSGSDTIYFTARRPAFVMPSARRNSCCCYISYRAPRGCRANLEQTYNFQNLHNSQVAFVDSRDCVVISLRFSNCPVAFPAYPALKLKLTQ